MQYQLKSGGFDFDPNDVDPEDMLLGAIVLVLLISFILS